MREEFLPIVRLEPVNDLNANRTLEIGEKINQGSLSGEIDQEMKMVRHQHIGVQPKDVLSPVKLEVFEEDFARSAITKKWNAAVGVSRNKQVPRPGFVACLSPPPRRGRTARALFFSGAGALRSGDGGLCIAAPAPP